jgi:DNA polymerase-3 subunit gamma/tau
MALMSYQALYRAWRSQTFEDVVGQSHITKTLQNALIEGSFSHAYLFSGPRGTGKTSTAKILAKAVNCEQGTGAEPCNQCSSCIGITRGSIVDVVEIDAASNNGVDEIRDIRDKVRFAPTEVKIKVYIIDEVHMLSQGAFNALLKTLEEPPAHVMFILATTESHKIPLTIISRCQRFDFKRISKKAIIQHLEVVCNEEEIKIEEAALHLLAQVAEGGMRDALSLLDQAHSFAEEEVTLDDVLAVTGAVSQEALFLLADSILGGRVDEAITSINTLIDQGKEPIRLVEDLIYYYRDMLLFQTAPNLEDILERVQITDEFKKVATTYSKEKLFTAIERLSSAQNEMKWTNHPRVFLEVACIQLIHQTETISQKSEEVELSISQLQPVLSRIDQLEDQLKKLQSGTAIQQGTEANEKKANRSLPPRQQQQSSLPVSQHKIKEMLKGASKPVLLQLTEKWAIILEEIKQKRITVHAWLIDSEPVASSTDFFILAFKSGIHRETTEKENHRQIIEEVVSHHLQSSAKMVTIMYNEWSEIKDQFIREQKGEKPEEGPQDNLYNEAVKLVGEDLVEVIDKK